MDDKRDAHTLYKMGQKTIILDDDADDLEHLVMYLNERGVCELTALTDSHEAIYEATKHGVNEPRAPVTFITDYHLGSDRNGKSINGLDVMKLVIKDNPVVHFYIHQQRSISANSA